MSQRSQENITQQCQHNFWKCQNEPTFTRKHSENITQQCQHNFWKCQNEPTFTRKHSENITQQCQHNFWKCQNEPTFTGKHHPQCWVITSCESWLKMSQRSQVMLTLLGDVFLWTFTHFGNVNSNFWHCCQNVFRTFSQWKHSENILALWTTSYITLLKVPKCFPNVFTVKTFGKHFGTFNNVNINIVG